MACKAYYGSGDALMSDKQYDKKLAQLKKLEEENPELIFAHSPTQNVGYPVNAGDTYDHLHKKYSLDNVFSVEELESWVKKKKEHMEEYDEFIAEVKVDGVSMTFRYSDGILVNASTRGDGYTGKSVIDKFTRSNVVPKKIDAEGEVEIVGELFMYKDHFNNLNEEEGSKYANPRNFVAGTVAHSDEYIFNKRKVNFYAFDMFYESELSYRKPKRQSKVVIELKRLGFNVLEPSKFNSSRYKGIQSFFTKEIIEFYEHWNLDKNFNKLPIDGIVVKVDKATTQEKLGYTNKFPNWAIAAKFEQEEQKSTLRSISLQVGKSGAVTPVANFDPIELDGSTVSKATLHNYDWLASLLGSDTHNPKRLHAQIGDTVTVEKAGGVIPKATAIEESEESVEIIKTPKHCPSCGSELKQTTKEIRCVNSECPDKIMATLTHFVSKSAMDIKGLSEKLLQEINSVIELKTVDKLYDLTYEDLKSIIGEKRGMKIYEAIQKSIKKPWTTVLYALSIPTIGKLKAERLSLNYNTLPELVVEANNGQAWDKLMYYTGNFGQDSTEHLMHWLKDWDNRELLKRLMDHGLLKDTVVYNNDAETYNVAVTGTLGPMSREDFKKYIIDNGGKFHPSITKNTSVLVVGNWPGKSKIDKAIKYNIKTISFTELNKLEFP